MNHANSQLFPELGFYTLPGHTRTPADMLDEIRQAETLGMGSAWISERFDVKEAAALCGAGIAVSDQIFIGTAATNTNLRHPLLTAAMANTLHSLSAGRFALGLARGVGIRQQLMGVDGVNNAQLRDFADIMRKLWHGEKVMYDGPLGKLPYLHINDDNDADIPLMFVGFGEKSLAFAATVFDGIILHTFISDEALARCVCIIRQSAEKAGRDPDKIKIWSVLATACDANESQYLRYIVARMATYLQAPGYGELLVKTNRWDEKILADFRADAVVTSMAGAIDSVANLEQLQYIRSLIPQHWLPAATGSPEQCAKRFNEQFDAGADGVIIHASTPAEFAPVLHAYNKIRRHQQFAGRSRRPA